MAVVHTTTAFVNAIKESANILKKNLAVIYVKDPYIDSDSEHEEETPEDENQPSNERIEEDMRPAIVKEETIQESKKVAVADESDDDRNSDNDLHMTGGENNFLNFDLLDLLNENAAEFNLELSKAQVGRLLSSVRIADRLEAAKDMDGLMEFLESLQAESEKMLDDTEATAEFTWKGLETKRQDIATLVGPNQSVVHAVRGGRWSARPVKGKITPLNQVKLATVGEEQEDAGAAAGASPQRQAQYYVYCKTCKSVTSGKLRVRCSICKEGAMVLQQDPSRWDDVLVSGKIRGSCKTSGCDGDKAEFYFKCAMHPAAEGDRCVALNLIRSNTRDIPCLACTDVKDPVLVFPCADGHAVCLDCFEVYCTTKLNDRQFVQSDSYGYTLPCPGSSGSCSSALISEAHHFRVLSEDQYERYHRFGTEEYVLKNGGVLCPGRGCGMGLLPEPGMRSVKCDGCQLEFCKECKEPSRRGHSCNQNQSNPTTAARLSSYRVNAENARRARWEAEAKQVIDQISKKCPGCRTNTEKSGGCNHMTCSRCNFEWCWICLIHWNPDCQGSHWFLQH